MTRITESTNIVQLITGTDGEERSERRGGWNNRLDRERIVAQVCEDIASGCTLADACLASDVSTRAFLGWCREHPEQYGASYQQAREQRAQLLSEKQLNLARELR